MTQMPDSPVSPPDSGAPDNAQATLQARRRLLRGGLGVAPVLMVSAPRSVMAGTCTTASAFTSFSAAASHQPFRADCSGHFPAYWRDVVSVVGTWPATCLDSTTPTGTVKFQAIFGAGYPDTTTLMDVLKIAVPTVNDVFAQHIVAALLNGRSNNWAPLGVVNEGTLKTMWSKVSVYRGYYEPTAGVKWYADSARPRQSGEGGCIAWLKSTMA
jgi:hypothetical protein